MGRCRCLWRIVVATTTAFSCTTSATAFGQWETLFHVQALCAAASTTTVPSFSWSRRSRQRTCLFSSTRYRGGCSAADESSLHEEVFRQGGTVTPLTVTTNPTLENYPFLEDGGERIVQEDHIIHDHWRRVISRRVQLPSGRTVDFELVGQRGTDQAVIIFVWHTATKTATMISEYMPSVHSHMMGLAAGMVETDKYGLPSSESEAIDIDEDVELIAARHELEEECRLVGGEWISLTDRDLVMDKYSTTRLRAYLVLDPSPVHGDEAKPRDDTEEGMRIHSGLSVDQIWSWLRSGRMTIVGSWATLLALNRLREMGEFP